MLIEIDALELADGILDAYNARKKQDDNARFYSDDKYWLTEISRAIRERGDKL